MSAPLYQSVLRALLQKSVWRGVRHEAANEVFTETTTRLLVAQIDHLHGRISDRDLTSADLRNGVEAAYAGSLQSDLLAYVDEIGAREAAAEPIVREVLARELLNQAAASILAGNNSGQFDADKPGALVDRAREVVVGAQSVPTITLTDPDLPTAGGERGRVISLGISRQLDGVLDGGAGLGEVVCFAAPPNVGKTSIMCAAGADMVRAGNSVLHIILGDSGPGKVLRLYERGALRLPKTGWTDDLAAQARAVLLANGGSLTIKDMRGIDVTTDILEGVILAYERTAGAPVDVVIIDYLELLAFGRGQRVGQEIRHHYGRIGRQTKRIAAARHTRIVTAWQINREGSDEDVITAKHLSESWDIFKHVDTLIALNRNATERANKRARLGILKQREEAEGTRMIDVYCNWSTMTIEDMIGVKQNGDSTVGNAGGEVGLKRPNPPQAAGPSAEVVGGN